MRLEGLGFDDLIWNRILDLPACSMVPQPTTLSRAPVSYTDIDIFADVFIGNNTKIIRFIPVKTEKNILVIMQNSIVARTEYLGGGVTRQHAYAFRTSKDPHLSPLLPSFTSARCVFSRV
jgi:hypothetical protein